MAKLRPLRPTHLAHGSREPEWIGGRAPMPTYLTGEGEPYRPEVLIWVGPDGAILGADLERPEEALDKACESLSKAIRETGHGSSRAPGRMRVADPLLAERLRAGHPSIEIACRPTPELDEILAGLWEAFATPERGLAPPVLPEVTPEARSAFYRAAAGLFRAAPWKVVPSDQDVFGLDIPALGVHGAALSVIGQLGESLGVVLFSSMEAFDAFCAGPDPDDDRGPREPPPSFSLHFDPRDEVADEIRRDIEELGVKVAGRRAYPWLLAVDEDLLARPLSARDFALGEAIARALPQALREKGVLRAAWDQGQPWQHSFSVRTHAGELDVALSIPGREPEPAPPPRPAHDLLGALYDMVQDEEWEDWVEGDARRRLEGELQRRFEASPEAQGLSDPAACDLVLQFAADHLGVTIATLDARGLGEIVFGLIPQKASVEASEAPRMIEALRAFYAFLGRECALSQAEACLRVLDGDATRKLEVKLSDPRNFGMAKSFIMAGLEAGYDVHTPEGIQAWVEASNRTPATHLGGWPGPEGSQRPQDRSAQHAKQERKKKARKRSRQARRKNR